MKYGIHTALVEEVIALVGSGTVFRPHESHSNEWGVVSDFDTAKQSAWEESVGEDELSWKDIRAKEMSHVKGIAYQSAGFREHREHLGELLPLFSNELKRKMPFQYFEALDDAIADLYNCAMNRCINGDAPSFFESLFTAYSRGLWPCGWDGSYPEGRIRVFCPIHHE